MGNSVSSSEASKMVSDSNARMSAIYEKAMKIKDTEYAKREQALEQQLADQAKTSEADKAEIDRVRTELDALHETRANERIRVQQGVVALQRQHYTMMNNIVAHSRGGESLNKKRELIIGYLSGMREDYNKMEEWCLDIHRGIVRIDKGDTILMYFHERSEKLVKEIKDIKDFVCTMKMADELKQKIAIHLESVLKPAIDLDNEVRKSRVTVIKTPKAFTMEDISKCLDMVEQAAREFPHTKTLEQCIEDEDKEYQQSIDSALSKLSIGN